MSCKIITCAGYYGTGSSAVTDLLSEFDNVYSLTDYEFRFVQDPEGISDLAYNLVENNHRHNSGHALKRYKKKVNFLSGYPFISRYEPYFNGQFKKISNEYIDKLADLKFKGYWHQDVIDKGMLFWFFERTVQNLYNRFLSICGLKNKTGDYIALPLMANEMTYISVPGKFFYEITRDYLDRLFSIANKDNLEYVMVDQLVPPTNTNRYLNFFNDLKIISVDRDPRDIFLLEKYVWHGGIVPNDIETFCKWFKLTRKHRETEQDDPSRVLRIMFEDLVYEYEKTRKRIIDFLGIDVSCHQKIKRYFDPEISRNNTRLWVQNAEYDSFAEVIYNELSEYCYNYI